MSFSDDYGQLFPYLGSKRIYLNRVLKHFVPVDGINNYSEPFLGSGAVFTFLARRGYFDNRKAILSDGNIFIAGLFKALETDFYGTLTSFLQLTVSWNLDNYKGAIQCMNSVRGDFKKAADPVNAAATYAVYSTAIQARVRISAAGEVSSSIRKNVDLGGDYYVGRLIYIADLLAKVKLSGGLSISHDYIQNVAPPANTFAFLDPPYEKEHKTYFNEYIKENQDYLQEATAAYAKSVIISEGAYIACNSTKLAHEIYGPDTNIFHVRLMRQAGKPATELLLTEYAGQSKSLLDHIYPVLDGTFGPQLDFGWQFFDQIAPMSALQRKQIYLPYGFFPDQEVKYAEHFADEQQRRRAVVSLEAGPNTRRL